MSSPKHISSIITKKHNNWEQGFVNSVWSKKSYTNLEYDKPKPFNNTKDLQKWKKQGFRNEVVNHGELCDMKKPHPWYAKDMIKWFEKTYNVKNVGISFFRMKTGCILPTHKDTYKKYRQLFKCPIKNIIRAIVFLDDWHPGHIFEIDNKSITEYKKGDFICWKGSTPHMAANIGSTIRYTMQITGHK